MSLQLAKLLMKSEYEGYVEEDYTKLFKVLENLTGKVSLIKVLCMFSLMI